MIRSMFEAADPVPAGLVDRIRLSVALAGLDGDLDGELARLTIHEAALARGAPEESRTITFDSSSLTIMIRIDANTDGRFAFLSVPRGTARIVVRPPEQGTGESQPGPFGIKTVVTPALML